MSYPIDEKIYLLTTEEAMTLVKCAPAGSLFYMHVYMDAPIIDKPDRIFSDGCSTSVKLSRKEAYGHVERMLSKVLEGRGGRIRIRSHSDTRYVASMGLKQKNITVYWIG